MQNTNNTLTGKVALVTGGSRGIGRATCLALAAQGAAVAVHYHAHEDAARTVVEQIREMGGNAHAIQADLGQQQSPESLIRQVLDQFNRIDILVNNAAEQHPQERLLDITPDQLERTFRTNIFAYFYMAREALKHMRQGGVIINTSSVTAYRGSAHLVDYASTKAAIVGFTRSLALALADKGIRVNGVAPGPIWTPLIPSTFDEEQVAKFGSDVPLGRPGEPSEVAPCFVFLVSSDSSYMTGQVLHPNGGEIINS